MQLLPAPAAKSDIQSELTTALAACCGAFIATATFSGMSKRVDAHRRDFHAGALRSGAAEPQRADADRAHRHRGRILLRVGASLDEAISHRVYDALVCMPLKAGNRGDGLQALRHLDNLRTFLSGMGPIAGLRRNHDRSAHEPEPLHDPDCDAA